MQTIHLTEDHVVSYLKDFAAKLNTLGEKAPQVWVSIGSSGSTLALRLARHASAQEVLLAAFDRSSDLVSFPHETSLATIIQGKRVLIVDGAVHSGGTLLRVLKEINRFSPLGVTSYALAVRRGAKIIPNHFGFLIGDHDRVQFPGRDLANNCLFEYGTYRKLSAEDASRDMITTGADFIDKLSWEDRLYEMHTDPKRHIYLHELDGEVCGFVGFRLRKANAILVDELGVDKKFAGQRLGGHLMRWAEHYARHRNCSRIELLAVDNKVAWYERLGYTVVPGEPLKLSGHQFFTMSKKLLYNLADDHTLGMGD